MIGRFKRRRNQGLKAAAFMVAVLPRVVSPDIVSAGNPLKRRNIVRVTIDIDKALRRLLQFVRQACRTHDLQRMAIG